MGGLVVGAAVAGVVAATLVGAGSVVAADATVVTVPVATKVVVSPANVVSGEPAVPDVVELQAPINRSEAARARTLARCFNMRPSLGGAAAAGNERQW